MKKFTFLLAALIALSGFTACTTQSAQLSPIGLDEAKFAALEAAGINLSDVVVEEVELEERNGQKYYSVDFDVNGRDYEFIVDALTGEIISSNIPSSVQQEVKPVEEKSAEAPKQDPAPQPVAEPKAEESKPVATPASKAESKPAESKASSVISEAKAKEIALNHAGVKESEVSFTIVKLDWDDGRQEYEVDFYKGNVEYDYEIDAVSGAILSADKEVEDDIRPAVKEEPKKEESKPAATPAPKPEKPSASVSESEAKKIALSQVPGAKESDIRGFKVDYDDGRVQYEGKIIYNEMEYEFEIDGHSGAIRDWDAESVYDD